MKTLKEKQEERFNNISYSLTPPFPREIFLEVNNTCNHKCFFCANEKMTRDKSFIDDKLAKRIMQESFEAGSRDITFYATGEPLIFPLLDEYIKFAKQIGYEYVFLTSNGALSTTSKMKDIIDAGLDSIKFSVNAGTRKSYKQVHGKDDFDKVIDTIIEWDKYRKASGAKLKMFVSFIPTQITKDEYHLLLEIIGNYIDQEVDQRVCSNQGGNMLENNKYEEINPENILGTLKIHQLTTICPDPFNRLTISSEGYLTACVVDYQNALVTADLSKVTIVEAWNNEEFQKLRKKHLEDNLEGTLCYNCLKNKNAQFEPLNKEIFKPLKETKDMESIYEKKV
ncbi:MAG: radical SAM protein [Campylobacterales bacterium]|nr:radical SAM protein [Campylobacterales bacterium]